jgi:hypothetical protein
MRQKWKKKMNDKDNTVYLSAEYNKKRGFVELQCVQKVAVRLLKVLEVMSTRIYTGQNPFNFIRKHFLQICIQKVPMHL